MMIFFEYVRVDGIAQLYTHADNVVKKMNKIVT